MRQIIVLILILALPWPALAMDGGAASAYDGLLSTGLKMTGGLFIVLGVVLLLYYLSRKGFGFLPATKSGAIKIVEMRHLMPKKALCLVEVRGKELLLGIGTERIEVLSMLDTPPSASPAASFEETLLSMDPAEKSKRG